jgi:peroxiredoxin 2/4
MALTRMIYMTMMMRMTAGSCGVAKERKENKEEMHCYDWFFCKKKLGKDEVLKTVLKK